MQPLVIALLGAVLMCARNETALAQRATPVAVMSRVQSAQGLQTPSPPLPRVDRDHPRVVPVAASAVAFGVAGGVAGYYATKQYCDRVGSECWDLLFWVPAGYVLGVAVGGGVAGTVEGCRSALLRSTGGALLGALAGTAAGLVGDKVAVVTLPLGPVLGATWLVTRCRTHTRALNAPVNG